MAARKALPQIVACRRAQGARAQIRLGQAACILRASFEPRGFGVLSLAFSTSGGSYDGRRRRVGDHIGGRRPQPPAQQTERNDPFPPPPPPLCSALTIYPRLWRLASG